MCHLLPSSAPVSASTGLSWTLILILPHPPGKVKFGQIQLNFTKQSSLVWIVDLISKFNSINFPHSDEFLPINDFSSCLDYIKIFLISSTYPIENFFLNHEFPTYWYFQPKSYCITIMNFHHNDEFSSNWFNIITMMNFYRSFEFPRREIFTIWMKPNCSRES